MSSVEEINVALAKALGVTDISGVSEVVLRIKAGDVPTVTITQHVFGERADTVVERVRTLNGGMDELDDVLEEWAYWATYNEEAVTAGACFSAEGNYRSPQHWQPPSPRPREPDPFVGPRVEAAWRTLDARSKCVLRTWYIVSLWALPESERRDHGKRLQLTAARCSHSVDTIEMLLEMAKRDLVAALAVR